MINYFKIFTSQILKSNVKLPSKEDESPKIQDNNQAITNGVINEESTTGLRSGIKTRAGTK